MKKFLDQYKTKLSESFKKNEKEKEEQMFGSMLNISSSLGWWKQLPINLLFYSIFIILYKENKRVKLKVTRKGATSHSITIVLSYVCLTLIVVFSLDLIYESVPALHKYDVATD